MLLRLFTTLCLVGYVFSLPVSLLRTNPSPSTSTVLAVPKKSSPPGCVAHTTKHTSTVSKGSTTTTTTKVTTTSLAKSCTFTGTQTIYSRSGCAVSCSTGFCIIDAGVTKSCGCPSVAIETVTTTVCPTSTPCYQCYTGWGTFVYTQPCTTGPTLPPLPLVTSIGGN
ncbi:hypothetical protein QBC43DRAFT_219407 [Cladorrhinum sp. PSN259]|nr:hypothetical protein QBC43DRAFT_219407 [Cladorrhinum sp. PSN259]